MHRSQRLAGIGAPCSAREEAQSRRAGHRLGRGFLAVVTLLITAGCGTTEGRSASSPASTPPAATPRAASSAPATPVLSVSPNTGLVGGEQLQVRVAGFPPHATVTVYECAATPRPSSPPGCGATASSTFYTGRDGAASGTFTAQSAARTGPEAPRVPCRQQCVLVGEAIIKAATPSSLPPPVATAALSFSATAPSSLADSALVDLTWVSTSVGWALAAQPCTTGSCARIAHTSDGGAHWQELPDPPAQLQDGTVDCRRVTCVSQLRFATPSVGYLFGPALLMTTNGGRSWQSVPGLQVETLAVADGRVFRVAYHQLGCPGPCQPALQDAAIGSTGWHTLVGQLAYPDRSDAARIVASGSTLLVALYGSEAGPVSAQAILYGSADGGALWRRQGDPCSGHGPAGRVQEEDLIDLAAAPGGFFAGLCSPHTGSATFVVTSTDGTSWRGTADLPNVSGLALLAAASPTTLAVSTGSTSGGGEFTARLLVSTDSGRLWATATTDTQQLSQQATPAWLGFETPQVGRWISSAHSIWSTVDGGLHWTRAAFG